MLIRGSFLIRVSFPFVRKHLDLLQVNLMSFLASGPSLILGREAAKGATKSREDKGLF